MKTLFTLAILVAMAMPSMATDWYSCPGVVTAAGNYHVKADMTISSGADCIDVNGANGDISILCDVGGLNDPFLVHITIGATNGGHPITIRNNTHQVALWHCKVDATNSSYAMWAYDNSMSGASHPSNPSLWSMHNTYIGGTSMVTVNNTAYFQSDSDTFTNTALQWYNSDHSSIDYATVNCTAAGSNPCIYGLFTNDSSHVQITNSTIDGRRTGTGAMDDGVVARCTGFYVCYDLTVDHVTVNNAYDAGVELTDNWDGVTITNNTWYKPTVAGLGCYGYWSCSLNNVTIDSNTTTAYDYNTRLILFGGGTSGLAFMTNMAISNNSIDDVSQGSGITDPNYTTSGITVTGNHFGANSIVGAYGGGSVTDGGGNYCYISYIGITCH